MARARRVFIHVQHLLGTGHLQRCALLARALVERGCRVLLCSGGTPVPTLQVEGFELHQLPVLRSPDASFSRLVDAAGNPPDEAYLQSRRRQLLRAETRFAADVVVIEGWPFARRVLSTELLALLHNAAARAMPPLIACSVRDVLQDHGKLERHQQAVARTRRWIDRILVHADPRIIEFGASFPLAHEIADRIVYTGYVTHPVAPAMRERSDEVLVSAGGGAVGLQLLRTALQAARLADGRYGAWRLLVSHAIDAADFRALREQVPAGVVVERNRADFLELLSRCSVSVSQAGYNTVAEILQTGTAAVLVPFASGRETEQRQRAQAFARRGRCICVAEATLAPQRLLDAIAQARRPGGASLGVDLDGAARGADYICAWFGASHDPPR